MFNAVVGQKQQLVTDGLIRYWDAEIDATTGSLFEQSGRSAMTRSGVGGQYNPPTETDPAYYKFFGNTTGRLETPAAADLDWTNGHVTVGLWLDGTSSTQFVYANQRDGLSAGTRFSLHINPSANTIGIYNGSGFNTIAATIDPSIYYMVSFNLSTTLNSVVYLDAVRLGSPAGTTTIQSGATSKKFELANTTTDFSGESFNGRILFCLNYSRQLLDSEVTQNFQYFRNRLRKFT
jgi:hypothetical protein